MRDICKAAKCRKTMDGVSAERDYCHKHRDQEDKKECQGKNTEPGEDQEIIGSGYELYC